MSQNYSKNRCCCANFRLIAMTKASRSAIPPLTSQVGNVAMEIFNWGKNLSRSSIQLETLGLLRVRGGRRQR